MSANNTDFLTRSNYLVGFLAVLVGMATFKTELSSRGTLIFGNHVSLLAVAVPMVLAILLATYIGALAHFTSNVTITKFALSSYLSSLSSFIAVLGLIYPIVIALLMLLTWIAGSIAVDSSLLKSISSVGSSAAALLGGVAAFVASRSIVKIRSEKDLDTLVKKLGELKKQRQITGYEFLNQYERLVDIAVDYLKLRGFGVGNRSLVKIARILESKNVFEHRDVDTAGSLNAMRNLYAHGQHELTQKELAGSLGNIEQLRAKIEKTILDLTSNEGSN